MKQSEPGIPAPPAIMGGRPCSSARCAAGALLHLRSSVGKVTAVTPSAGPKQGRNHVTITGDKFLQTSSIVFGETSATKVTFVSPPELKRRPAERAGALAVRVAALDGECEDHFPGN